MSGSPEAPGTREVLDGIDAALQSRCGHCAELIPDSSPSAYFCRESCQEGYHAARTPTVATRPVSEAPHRFSLNGREYFLPAVRWCPHCGQRSPAPLLRMVGPCGVCGWELPFMTYLIKQEPLRGGYVLTLRWRDDVRRAVCRWTAPTTPDEVAMLFEALEECAIRDSRRGGRQGDVAAWRAAWRAQADWRALALATPSVFDPRALLRLTIT